MAVPCVYALLENKTQDSYERLLSAIEEQCQAWSTSPNPAVVNVDFESAAISAVKAVLGEQVSVHGCFYHLTQSTWRKVQEVGLAAHYKTDKDFYSFCGMLDGLAFLPVEDVKAGMEWLKTVAPPEAADVISYFDETYVNGKSRPLPPAADGSVRYRLAPARFPPPLWNVHAITIANGNRTNNVAEGWNNRLTSMVGHYHPSVWTIIEVLQADAAETSAKLERHTRGNLSPRRRPRATQQFQSKMRRLCSEYDNKTRSLEAFLRAIGHSIRFIDIPDLPTDEPQAP